CHGGVQVCAPSGLGYIPGCTGQVLPQPEACGDGQDHDCNGAPNDVPDVDGDGWTACQGDCCEYTFQCGEPTQVNPGAIEVQGDAVDNDCSGQVDEALPTCSSSPTFSGVTPQSAASAMELCKFINPGDKTWGVTSVEWVLADGSAPSAQALGDIQNLQAAILDSYGTSGGNNPKKNATMLGLSSGKMRDSGDPGYVLPIAGTQLSSAVNPPPVYTAAHGGGLLPGSCGNGTCQVGTGANDSINLRVKMRAPSNAKSFSYDFRFFTGEYQTYQCTQFNDYFLALLTSANGTIPADHNISFDAKGNAVSVNNGFFQTCGGNGKNCGNCPNGTADLAGTGMDQVNGGGTLWLTTTAPVNPGEDITLELTIFDVGDHAYDSLVLIDNFAWSATPSSGPTTGPAK
ncbi:MAG: hypothetical protein EOO75_15475, partial [Myxococcales bacterium]